MDTKQQQKAAAMSLDQQVFSRKQSMHIVVVWIQS